MSLVSSRNVQMFKTSRNEIIESMVYIAVIKFKEKMKEKKTD
jgi:hypothetical protein